MSKNREIERRWIVTSPGTGIPRMDGSMFIQQGYLERSSPVQSLRVRITDDARAVITGKTGSGIIRGEREHRISLEAARMLLDFCDHRITKLRHVFGNWVLDVFGDELRGITILEYESADEQDVRGAVVPPWARGAVEVTDSLTNLHLARLATDLKNTGQDPVGILERRLKGKVRRVAIVGGPGSGKSTLLRELRGRFPDVHIVPEVASIIIAQVGIRPGRDPFSLRRFQRTVWRTQLIFEMTSMEQALTDGKTAVVLDRGTMDCAAYLPGGVSEMEALLQTDRSTEYGRYDAVLWLPPPPPCVYDRIRKNNPARSEDYATAVAVGTRIREAWESHPNFMRLDSLSTRTGAWDELVVNAFRMLDGFLAP